MGWEYCINLFTSDIGATDISNGGGGNTFNPLTPDISYGDGWITLTL